MKQFRSRLKELREKSGFSQKELAEKLSLSRPTITAYESGSRAPTIETIINIADIFEVSIDYLFGRSDDPCLNQRGNNDFWHMAEKIQEQIRETDLDFEEKEVMARHIDLSLKQIKAWLGVLKR